MNIEFDPRTGTVGAVGEDGTMRWPCELDISGGAVRIELAGERYSVAPLKWRQKVLLARYVSLGAEFIEQQFLRMATAGAGVPAGKEERSALRAVALWVNAPDAPGIALDNLKLASVALDLIRGAGIAPDVLDGRDAVEVESMWRALTNRDVPNEAAALPGSALPQAARSSAVNTKVIRVIPDPPQPVAIEGAPVEIVEAAERPTLPELPQAKPAGHIAGKPFRWTPTRTVVSPARQQPVQAARPQEAIASPEHAGTPSGASHLAESVQRFVQGNLAEQLVVQPANEVHSREIPPASTRRSSVTHACSAAVEYSSITTPEALPHHAPEAISPHAEPFDAEAIFDEFSDRLEEAASQLGIEVAV